MPRVQLAPSPALPTQTRTKLAALFLLAALLSPSYSVFLEPTFPSKAAILYDFEYSALRDTVSRGLGLGKIGPLPNFPHAYAGWYRYGLRLASEHRRTIEQNASAQVPSILIAAAIASQGNSLQRPFGWNGPERVQVWLGQTFDWPWPRWKAGELFWDRSFEEPSVGIAQLIDDDMGPVKTPDYNLLFDDTTSIRLMAAKLSRVDREATRLRLNETKKFILTAIGNNMGLAVVNALQAYDGDLERYISEDSSARWQLASMMTYVDILHDRYDWPMPEGINRDYVWWLVRRGSSEP